MRSRTRKTRRYAIGGGKAVQALAPDFYGEAFGVTGAIAANDCFAFDARLGCQCEAAGVVKIIVLENSPGMVAAENANEGVRIDPGLSK